MASTQAKAERRAAAIARLQAAADAIAARSGATMPPPAPTKDREIDQIAALEYAAGTIEAALAMLSEPEKADAAQRQARPAKAQT